MNNLTCKSIFRRAIACFDSMNDAPRRLLVFGQAVIAAYITGFLIYAAVNYTGSVTIVYTELLDMLKASICELTAGLSILWAGALFIDTMMRRR